MQFTRLCQSIQSYARNTSAWRTLYQATVDTDAVSRTVNLDMGRICDSTNSTTSVSGLTMVGRLGPWMSASRIPTWDSKSVRYH
jgi:hypothetical protein